MIMISLTCRVYVGTYVRKTRFASVFNTAALNPSHVICSTNAGVEEYWKSNHYEPFISSATETFNSAWTPPKFGTIKISSGGAFSRVTNKATIGVIARDGFGMFLRGWRELVDVNSSFLSELLGCRKAIHLASDFNRSKVIIEFDRLELFRAILCIKM